MQVAVRRAIELTESMMRDANAYAYTPVWTSARSLFELSALMFDTADKVHKLRETWDLTQYLEFSEHLDNVMLGFKSKEWQPKVPERIDLDARNILGIIKRIDRDHLKGSYLSLYELLSEVAHPNYMGMLEQYQRISGDDLHTVTFVDSPARADIRTITIPIGNAHGTLAMLVKAVEDYESWLNAFLDLAAANVSENSSGPTAPPSAEG